MLEKELQGFVDKLIGDGRLVDSIAGWDEVESVALDQVQGSERLLLLDDIVLHRVADAALMVRDRLVELTPVSNYTRSISLDRSEKLYADLLYVSPETGSVVVFEIKRAKATARETITELLAYEQELRNHLPFSARTDICFVVVSTDYAPLLDHSLSSLITWHGLKILCLEADESLQLTVRLPSGWTSLGQDVIPARHIDTMTLRFTPHDPHADPVSTGCLLGSALDLIGREADRGGVTGFGFAWENSDYPIGSIEPAGLTVARVNPAGFLGAAKADYFLGAMTRSPLHKRVAELGCGDRWHPSSPELDAATRFLSSHGTVSWHRTGSWRDMRSDQRHRSTGPIMDRYAVPVVFNSWGLIGDYTRDLLTNPARLADTCGELAGAVVGTHTPDFALKVIDTIAPDEKIPTFGAQWFSRLGFRLARLWTYAKAYQVKTDPLVRNRIRSLLAWARADLAVPMTELQLAASLADTATRPPQLVIGPSNGGEPTEDPDVIRQLVTWIGDDLIGNTSPLHKTLVEAAFQNAQALDEGLLTIAPEIDLREIVAQTIYNARGGLEIAAHVAHRRRGALVGLTVLLHATFDLPCEPDADPAALSAMIDTIPADRLLDGYTQAVPAALDIAYPPLHFGGRRERVILSSGAVAILRRKIRALWAAGRPAGVYIDGSGEYGICLLEDEVLAMFRSPGDDQVIVRSPHPGGMESHFLRTWTELATEPSR